MAISPISFSLPYQGRTILVDDVSKLQALRWSERCEIKQLARELGSNLEHDLSGRVNLIHNTLTEHLPKASEEAKNIFIACLKVALLSSLIAGAILGGIFLGPGLPIVLAVAALAVSSMFYVETAEGFTFPERRIQEGEPTGPWFCPNIETLTLRGKIAVGSVVWPMLSGLVLPLVEACTRKSRWENVLAKQNEQLANIIPSFCEFYKQHGPELIDKLNEKIEAVQDRWILSEIDQWEDALESVHAQIAFLQNFDPDVPDLNIDAEFAG
jgi:hypothetical protein